MLGYNIVTKSKWVSTMTKFHKRPNIFATEVVLKVVNIKKSLEFYKSIMGFKVLKESENEFVLTADGNNPIVTIISSEDVIAKVPRRTGLYHFAILLPDRLHLGLFLKNIRSEKYPIVGGSNHGVSEAIYLQDPDDNGIEVYADTSEDKWDKNDYSINMVTERLDYDNLIEITGDKTWNGAPIDTIIGHMHLHVADLDEAYKFYNTIGFNLTQAMKHQAYFVSTGGYHHHIGLNIWNGKGAEPLPDNSAGMKYFTLKFPASDILQEKILNLKVAGYLIIEKDGDIYARDPSQNLIKLIV